jgi:predicted permease
MMDRLVQDVRFGVRLLRAHPAATATALLSLALGIGANASMFTIVSAALLRPLPVTAPGELVFVYGGDRGAPWGVTSYPTYVDLRDRATSFAGLASYAEASVGLATDEGDPEAVRGAIVSGNYFEVLGVAAHRGRLLTPADDRSPGAHPVAVVGHDLWVRRFGGRNEAVGATLRVNGRPYTVVGVVPPGFRGAELLEDIEMFVPMMMQAAVRPPRAAFSGEMDADLLSRRESGFLSLVGRLRPGAGFDEAQAELSALAARTALAHPETDRGRTFSLYPVSRIDPRAYPLLRNASWLLMGVAGLVLLIATANVASLLVARAVARRREIALRLALGGSRGRLVRQLLTESLLVALGGGALGLLAAAWSIQALARAVPSSGIFSFRLDAPIDWRVLAFTTMVTVVGAVLAGLAPALQGSRPELVGALRDADPAAGAGRTRRRGQQALVVGQLALSLTLLVVAGLFLKSLWRAQGLSAGFDVDRIATASLQIDLLRYTRERGQQFYRDVVERVEALPGVSAASLVRAVPLAGGGRAATLRIEGREAPASPGGPSGGGAPQLPIVATNVVGPRYFATMGIGVAAGREFTAGDVEGAPLAAVVTEAFAARYFPGERAVGRRIALGQTGGDLMREIVGVVGDSRHQRLDEPPRPLVYLPVGQRHETGMTLVVRSERDPAALAPELRRLLTALEPNLPVSSVQPYVALVASALFPARVGARLMALFAALAVTLAAVGLYGLAAFNVAGRLRELGIRAALGARRRDLLALVMKEALVLVAAGLAIGGGLAALVSGVLRGFLYVSPLDPAVFTLVALILVAVMLGATFLPARRAAKSDPLAALRAE